MKKLIISLSVIYFTCLIVSNSYTQTIIPGGDIYGNWTIDGSPYLVMGDITIPDLATLLIDPGVTVEFQGHYALYVQGRLLAIGTESDTITFTVNDTTGFHLPDTTLGGWYGVKIADTPEQNDTTKISYCKLQYGKAVGQVWWLNAGGAICVVNFDKVIISNCLITHNYAGGTENEVPSGGGIHLAWSDVIITNNTISYNKAKGGGGLQIHDSHPIFSGNTFLENEAMDGGGINMGGISNIIFNGDYFINNKATNTSGGIGCWDVENWTFNNVTFSGNTSNWGGGIGIFNGNITFNNCVFDNNISSVIGGGIAADYSELVINNTSFSNDSSSGISGALHGWHTDYTIDNCSFTNNSASQGGAIFTDFGTLEITNSTFTGNLANDGAAIRNWCCNLSIDSSLFQENHVYSQGGALDIIIDTGGSQNAYQIIFENTKFIENSADYRCGAISLEQINSDTSLTNITIDNCEFSENRAERIGAMRIIGNIHDVSISNSKFNDNSSDMWTGCMTISNWSTGTVENCLFTYNSAGAGSSGAAGGSNWSDVNYVNCTFAANTSAAGGAGIALRKQSKANIINCIFWGNQPDQISLVALTDTTPCSANINYCDIQYGLDSIMILDSISVVNWGLGNINEQPMFEDILNEDYSLSSSSPCLGVGIDTIDIEGIWYFCPETDLHGDPRPNPEGTMPDMGAIESPYPDTTGFINHHKLSNNIYNLKNYPNPFNDQTTFEFYLPESNFTELKIFNSLGELLAILHSDRLAKGKHEIMWSLDQLPDGVYFYYFRSGDHTEMKKTIIIH